MDAKLQRRIQRYGWDKAAEEYEEYWRRQIEPAQMRLLELAALRPGERVLDIACGTGLITFPAAIAVGMEGLVVGTDISAGMIDRGREEAAKRGLANVTFQRVDAEALDFPENSFDAAFCSLGLMYVPEPLKALRQMRNALKPGGRMAASVWGQRERCGWAGIFPVVDARVKSEVCPMFFQLGTADNLRAALEMTGFCDIEVERLATMLDYASEEEAIGAAFAGGPVALAYAHFDAEIREEAHAEYLGTIEPYRRGAGYSIAGEFVVALARKK
uniref:Demethylmenaquinone methyltransferase n=1 Tax=Solibacter usitatus (strain Ellin6076) TaxID=234267 RepID=Q01W19_SOLUE